MRFYYNSPISILSIPKFIWQSQNNVGDAIFCLASYKTWDKRLTNFCDGSFKNPLFKSKIVFKTNKVFYLNVYRKWLMSNAKFLLKIDFLELYF